MRPLVTAGVVRQSEPGAVATGPPDCGFGIWECGLFFMTSSNQKSEFRNPKSGRPVATAPGSDLCLLLKKPAAECRIAAIRQSVEVVILRDRDVVRREGRSGRTLEFRDRFVQIRLSLKLAASGD